MTDGPRIALAGSVSFSRVTLERLLHHRANIVGVLGLARSKSATVSDYARLDDLAVEGDVPYLDFETINAKEVADASVNQQQWFAKGTGPEAGKTRALPEIWTKTADFDAAIKMFEGRAPKLLAAVKAKDAAAVQAAFREVGGSCKNCHDSFRAPE
jgi:cytochrome c556